MAGVMLVLLLAMNFAIQRLVSDYAFTRLQHDAESIINVLQQDTSSHWGINPSHLSSVYDRVRSGHYYVIKVGAEVIRSRSLFDLETPEVQLSTGQEHSPAETLTQQGPGNEVWLIYQQQVEKNGQSLTIWVAEDIHPVQQQLLIYSIYTVLLIVLLALLQFYVQQKLLNRAFAVFDRVREHIKSIHHKATLPVLGQIPEEITPLVKEIDRLVDHQQKRIERTRNAISNLAHEIKRPLQILALQTEGSVSDQQAVAQIQLIIDRELKRAKISGVGHSGGIFDALQDMPFLLDMMQRLYPDVTVNMNDLSNESYINFDRVDMLELLGNLLDNACKFAHHEVTLQLNSSKHEMTLVVNDDGPGVKADALDKITQRGYRLDESRSGHGLGLTICADIVEIYHGEIDFKTSDLGGLKVCVRLPVDL